MRFTPQDEEFRADVREWLKANLTGPFAGLRRAGGPGREHERYADRLAWHRHLAAAGWTCLGWPAEHGGRGATLAQQVIFHEEYARAGAPAGSRSWARNCSGRPAPNNTTSTNGSGGREAFGRAAQPWEVANVMVFLASDYASYLTGEVIAVSSQHP